jgi:hypothetical protein
MKVNDTDPRVAAMQPDWSLIDALLGGTRTMRAAGKTYMPRFGLEDEQDYSARLNTSTLFPAYEQTIKEMVGRVFAEQIELGDDVPAWIKNEVWPDVDRQGINGHAWARGWFAEALGYSMSHVFVDAPPATGIRTKADQAAAGIRPYLIRIKTDRILGWQVGDDGQLSQVRITWSRVTPGDFGPIVTPQIRVYDRVDGKVLVRVFEEREASGKKEWVLVETITIDLPIIPLVTCYTKRVDMLEGVPPLLGLAYLNVKHWNHQSATDSLNVLTQLPLLVATGLNEETTTIAAGAKTAIKLPMGCTLAFVEHSGKAVESGRTSLKDLEAQMKAIGAKLVEPGEGTKTATQASEEASSSNSPLGAMVEDLQDALEQVLYVIGLYRNEATGGSVEVKANLDPDNAPIESMGVIGKMVATGGLSRATQFEEAKRRSILSDELVWEEEQARIETDGPPPGSEPAPTKAPPK